MSGTAGTGHAGPDADRARREMVERRPHPALAGLVRGYCGYRYDLGEPVWTREGPHGGVTVILGFGPPIGVGWVARPERPVDTVTSFVAGVHDEAAFTVDAGRQYGMQIDLSPLGAFTLLAVPSRELAGRVVPLEDVLGARAAALVARLGEAPGWPERFAELDAELLRWLERAPSPHPVVVQAWSLLRRTDGRATVTELCAATGHSRRHLTSLFRREVGLPPKTMARVLRFHRAQGLLLAPDPPPLAAIAAECGYYDQAHLNRDFTALAGCTPTRLRAERRDSPASP
ncbi:AraC-like DNA-binding protein [Spinactinospora alkalitolerans]|uniref:AraC-like DNA-binding protein n=1 Tax=Spinactinospora alkalitolerans TaxID=687207 RepID=A0A852TV55_9ACTN|nr:helix-turn-helix domain-containing protein [Spinactinospora alkalitolerans]NYE48346.1 AraC-like DNA-binding protein [Spinactinospora alkalitolerans]